jgi:hypothetical protein
MNLLHNECNIGNMSLSGFSMAIQRNNEVRQILNAEMNPNVHHKKKVIIKTFVKETLILSMSIEEV